jgi:hypothetical protein
MSGVLQTGLACPHCDVKGVTGHLMTRIGAIGSFCPNGHTFNDLEELKNMNPRKLPVNKPLAKPQDGHEEFRLMMPSALRQALQSKFGDPPKVAENIVSFIRSAIDPGTVIINSMDMQQMSEWIGHECKDAGSLKGAVFGLTSDLKQAKASLKISQDSQKGRGITVDLSEIEEELQQRAENCGITVQEMVKQTVGLAVKNGWV